MRLTNITSKIFHKDIAGEKTGFNHLENDIYVKDVKNDLAGEKTSFEHIPHPNRGAFSSFVRFLNGHFISFGKSY